MRWLLNFALEPLTVRGAGLIRMPIHGPCIWFASILWEMVPRRVGAGVLRASGCWLPSPIGAQCGADIETRIGFEFYSYIVNSMTLYSVHSDLHSWGGLGRDLAVVCGTLQFEL